MSTPREPTQLRATRGYLVYKTMVYLIRVEFLNFLKAPYPAVEIILDRNIVDSRAGLKCFPDKLSAKN